MTAGEVLATSLVARQSIAGSCTWQGTFITMLTLPDTVQAAGLAQDLTFMVATGVGTGYCAFVRTRGTGLGTMTGRAAGMATIQN